MSWGQGWRCTGRGSRRGLGGERCLTGIDSGGVGHIRAGAVMSMNAVNDELCESIIVIDLSANVMVVVMDARVG
jgi:hypothetical protein